MRPRSSVPPAPDSMMAAVSLTSPKSLAEGEEPRVIGSYAIAGTLGEGGMGVVYRARHTSTGELVALKTVKLANPVYLSSMRREIQRLRRLSHPGVVRVLDDGVHEGLPWYAMELLEGTTWEDARERSGGHEEVSTIAVVSTQDAPVREAVNGIHATHAAHGMPGTQPAGGVGAPDPARWAPTGPVTIGAPIAPAELPTLIRRARRLCDALAYIHGEGVVHRDLKPANVFLRSSGQPVLVDFGLVAAHGGSQGREELDVSVMHAGTIGYMAPEQLAGDLSDARADIFAMGCLLYEQITGRLPFSASVPERLKSVARGAPLPSVFAPFVPAALDDLVMRMLASDPRERIGHAYDVSAELAALEGERERAPASDPSPESARAYLYRASFAGRGELFDELMIRVRRLSAGSGGTALLGGESGGGKTRILMEIARRASLGRILVVAGECSPQGAASDGASRSSASPLHPLRPLLQTIADICRTEGAAATAALLGKRLHVLAPFEPALATVPGAEDCPEVPVLAAEAARDRVLASVAETLIALGQLRPLLLLIDDLQWADALTLDVLSYVTRPDAPVPRAMILGAYRVEETLAELEELASRPGVERFMLARLDERTVGSLIGDMLGRREPPLDLARFVSQRAEGNPFFVTEYLRTILAEGLLRRGRDGQWTLAGAPLGGGDGAPPSWTSRLEKLALPRTVRDLVERHLQGLGPQLRGVVGAASVLGRDVRAELLAVLSGLSERDLDDAINELLRRQVLQIGELGGYRFAHDKLRETAYDALTADERRRLHRAAAAALEARGVEAQDLEVIASHWDRAHVHDKAREYLVRACEGALAAGAHRQAAALAARALEISPEGSVPAERLAHLHHLHADALFSVGDTKRGAEHAERALELFGVHIPRSPLRAAMALASGFGEQLLRAVRRAPPTAPADEAIAVERALAAERLSTCYVAEQRSPLDITSATLLAANLADRAGPRGPKATPYSVLGAMFGFVGVSPLERFYFEGARRDAAHRGDRVARAGSAVMECALYQSTARWTALYARAEDATEVATEIGDLPQWETLMMVRSGGELLHGRLDDAAHHLDAVRRSATARGGRLILAWSTALTCTLEVWLDRPERAIELARTARHLFERDAGIAVANAVAAAAAASLRLGDTAAALAGAEETLALLRNGPIPFQMWPACMWVSGVFLELWENAARHDHDPRALRDKALAACAAARSFSRMSRVGGPIALCAEGSAARIDGRRDRAEKLLEQAVRRAIALELPLVESHARLERALLSPPDSPRRVVEARRAEDQSRAAGSAYWASRAADIAAGTRHREGTTR